jgi:hypothetical protein
VGVTFQRLGIARLERHLQPQDGQARLADLAHHPAIAAGYLGIDVLDIDMWCGRR